MQYRESTEAEVKKIGMELVQYLIENGTDEHRALMANPTQAAIDEIRTLANIVVAGRIYYEAHRLT